MVDENSNLDQEIIEIRKESGYNDPDIIDDAENDEAQPIIRYDVSSYGTDFDVEGLVKRFIRGEIFVPPFQREYVWNMSDASKFIESLLLGLPVPGVFLAREPETNKLLVIDGQQRLKTLSFFYEGFFNPTTNESKKRVFKLSYVQHKFDGKTYETLEEADRIKLNDSIIHATIIKQDYPRNDDTSIYYIFERLNKYGRKLTPQEIRTAIYHGPFIEMLNQINEGKNWRDIYGKKNIRLKDRELILRFFALYFDRDNYAKPMENFLTKFCQTKRSISKEEQEAYISKFNAAIELIYSALLAKAFKPERGLNTAVYDSVMVAIATMQDAKKDVTKEKLYEWYTGLLANTEYQQQINSGTSDEKNVAKRIELSISELERVIQ
jgi:uncharacterized protein with ParB-like and HNH nuclease domain